MFVLDCVSLIIVWLIGGGGGTVGGAGGSITCFV